MYCSVGSKLALSFRNHAYDFFYDKSQTMTDKCNGQEGTPRLYMLNINNKSTSIYLFKDLCTQVSFKMAKLNI